MKPILMKIHEIRAILDGRKTQTRRVVKRKGYEKELSEPGRNAAMHEFENLWQIGYENGRMRPSNSIGVFAPYQPGDILWVRETWRVGAWNENTGCIAVDYKADGFARREWIEIKDPELFEQYWIQSTDDAVKAGLETDSDGQYHWEPGKGPTRWRPSIFMPREAARIYLRVTNVRVERLQNISFDDAIAEGMGREGHIAMGISCPESEEEFNFKRYPERLFRRIWDNLNAKRGYGWERNPWVWVISFERISKEEAIELDKVG